MASDPIWVAEIVPAIVTLAGLLIVRVCRPLIEGKIAPNHTYGIRTPTAFSSEENWYRINRVGGGMLRSAGVFVTGIGLAGFVVAPLLGMGLYNLLATGLVLLGILVAAVRILQLR